MNNEILDRHIEKFLFAGNSYFIMTSKRTGTKYQFHICSNDEKTLWFVNVVDKHGAEYAGYIKKFKGAYNWYKGRGGKYDLSDNRILSLMWLTRHLHDVDIQDKITIQHVGRCARCGKKLTTPESIELGLGPICADVVFKED